MSGAPLPGGWKQGDAMVFVGYPYSSSNGEVKYGDFGTVLGPYPGDNRLVKCSFPNLTAPLNVLAESMIITEAAFAAPLPGGWKQGDAVVFVRTPFSDSYYGEVKYGDVGTVLGPYPGDDARVDCSFPNITGPFNVIAAIDIMTEAAFAAPLPGGWKKGDAAVFVSTYSNGDVKYGDVGTVLGPCTGDDMLVQCTFPNYTDNTRPFNLLAEIDIMTEAAFEAPLPGGWKKGDAAVLVCTPLFSDSNVELKYGNVGTVLGPYPGNNTLVQCSFPNLLRNLAIAMPGIATEAAFAAMKICAACKVRKIRSAFANAQLKKSGAERRCIACVDAGDKVPTATLPGAAVLLLTCSECSIQKPSAEFSKAQLQRGKKGGARKCSVCVLQAETKQREIKAAATAAKVLGELLEAEAATSIKLSGNNPRQNPTTRGGKSPANAKVKEVLQTSTAKPNASGMPTHNLATVREHEVAKEGAHEAAARMAAKEAAKEAARTAVHEAEAQNNPGAMYQHGHGVKQDYAKALEHFTLAADQGHADAQTSQQEMIDKMDTKRNADKRIAISNALGDKFFKKGDQQDYAKAFKHYTTAADLGSPHAQCRIAAMYENSYGVDEDIKKALAFFTLAADQGYAEGQCGVGSIHEDVDGDYEKALPFYNLAVAQGHAGAQYLLAFMYRDGDAVPEDNAKSVALFTSAAEQGHPDAQELLAWMYTSRQQYSLAAKFYKMAADQGVQGALYHFGKATKLAAQAAERGEAVAAAV